MKRTSIWLRLAVLSLLVAAGSIVAVGWYAYQTWNRIVRVEPRLPLSLPGAQPGEPQEEAPPPEWTGKDRVNILLVGVDQREPNEIPRTDTIIVASIDPVTKSAALVSFPRDLWVQIPGYGNDRINAAYPLGEGAREAARRNNKPVTLTGAGLLRRTIEINFGIPIHFFVAIDFQGFIRGIDALGGVLVDVERPIKDDEYPSFNYPHYERIYIPAGLQLMDGATALRYVRSRHGDSDFGRARRQQQVILAARQRALQLNAIARLPQIVAALQDSIRTDMQLPDMIALARLAREIEPSAITTRVIDEELTTHWITPAGADVQVPKWPEVRRMLAQLFADTRLAAEAARIEVRNGTTIAGLARRTAQWLEARGYTVVDATQADRSNYVEPILIDYGNKPYTRALLARELRIPVGNIRVEAGPPGKADIVVVLGSSFTLPDSPAPTPAAPAAAAGGGAGRH